MDIALVEMIMEVAGVTQSKIQMCEQKMHEELPPHISEKYNINNQLYTIYKVPECPEKEIKRDIWSFYQCILYFLKKDYFMESEDNLLKEYEKFLVSFKHDIEKMFYVTHKKCEFNVHDIKDKDFLKILSRYIELKIIIMNSNSIECYLEENSKNKKIVIFEKDNLYYPVIDNRFQGYEFVNETVLEPKEQHEEQERAKEQPEEQVTETKLRAMNKDMLANTAAHYGIEVTKQGKTKIISRTRIELISDILKQLGKK